MRLWKLQSMTMIVSAESEEAAREIASRAGADVWLDANKSTCVEADPNQIVQVGPRVAEMLKKQ